MERKLTALKLKEEKTVVQIKQAAKEGNVATARTLAKSLICLQEQRANLISVRDELQGVSTQLTVSPCVTSTKLSCGLCRLQQRITTSVLQ